MLGKPPEEKDWAGQVSPKCPFPSVSQNSLWQPSLTSFIPVSFSIPNPNPTRGQDWPDHRVPRTLGSGEFPTQGNRDPRSRDNKGKRSNPERWRLGSGGQEDCSEKLEARNQEQKTAVSVAGRHGRHSCWCPLRASGTSQAWWGCWADGHSARGAVCTAGWRGPERAHRVVSEG